MYADGRLLSSESSGVHHHSDVLAKLIADGLADSCSQVLASKFLQMYSLLTSTYNSQAATDCLSMSQSNWILEWLPSKFCVFKSVCTETQKDNIIYQCTEQFVRFSVIVTAQSHNADMLVIVSCHVIKTAQAMETTCDTLLQRQLRRLSRRCCSATVAGRQSRVTSFAACDWSVLKLE